MLEQEIRTQLSLDIANRLKEYREMQPRTIGLLNEEAQLSAQEFSEMQNQVMQDFENRRLNFRYFAMIENRTGGAGTWASGGTIRDVKNRMKFLKKR